MSVVRAVVVDPDIPGGARMGEIPAPRPQPHQALVEVHHVALNHGDLLTGARPAGTVLGGDASGVVVQVAADGSGPAAGTRVAALIAGAWAERLAVDTANLGVIPPAADPAHAAALPVAGLSALRALRAGGPILGKRVLVNGASGGVGRMAVQLAVLGGAHVIASVRSADRAEGPARLGAHQVVVGLDGVGAPVDLVLDNLGGPHLVAAWNLLAPGGNIQGIGWASGEPAVLPPYATWAPGAAKTLSSFGDDSPTATDLGTLLGLLAEGRLSPEIDWRGPWHRFADAMRALSERRIAGKAVLDVKDLSPSHAGAG
ncbi:zinc-binding dehydrogenase [Sinosporangium siamense]|uniref:Oxidoreductase n=1 Tax=Sinosporangium siamense TaxID=1367973 RepID=A0A919RFD0_9ACTN|nr:zinc-binding dehydrogenase [Sinosporangium siamense]GII92692.1 oxidoreductase [Sinosporangium siamense]